MKVLQQHSWKLLSALLTSMALTACGSDSDGGDSKGDKFLEDLVGIWISECRPEVDRPYDASRSQWEVMEDGKLENSGIEYWDENCNDAYGTWGPDEAEIEIGAKFDEGEGGSSGYELDYKGEDGTGKSIISKIQSDEGGDYFFLGVDVEGDARPDEFNTDVKWYKDESGEGLDLDVEIVD